MILEIAMLNIRDGEEAAFERAMKSARALIAATPGFHGLQLRRCIETPNRYVLFVDWDSVEAHEVGFRKSERYSEWRRLLHHFYDPAPIVEHYADDIISARSGGDDASV